MSILIKGIDLPNSGQIELIIRPHGKVLNNTKGIYAEAIQIPTPHGRLIDGDELRATLRRWTEDEWNQKASPVSWAYAYEDLIDLIDDAPTVLESEE